MPRPLHSNRLTDAQKFTLARWLGDNQGRLRQTRPSQEAVAGEASTALGFTVTPNNLTRTIRAGKLDLPLFTNATATAKRRAQRAAQAPAKATGPNLAESLFTLQRSAALNMRLTLELAKTVNKLEPTIDASDVEELNDARTTLLETIANGPQESSI